MALFTAKLNEARGSLNQMATPSEVAQGFGRRHLGEQTGVEPLFNASLAAKGLFSQRQGSSVDTPVTAISYIAYDYSRASFSDLECKCLTMGEDLQAS